MDAGEEVMVQPERKVLVSAGHYQDIGDYKFEGVTKDVCIQKNGSAAPGSTPDYTLDGNPQGQILTCTWTTTMWDGVPPVTNTDPIAAPQGPGDLIVAAPPVGVDPVSGIDPASLLNDPSTWLDWPILTLIPAPPPNPA
jgi:hypothetical protein